MNGVERSSSPPSTHVKYPGEQLDVEEWRFPEAQRTRFEVITRPQVVLSVPALIDGRMLLVRQFRAAVRGWTLEFPAGKVDGDEDPETAMRRELREEVGATADQVKLIGQVHTAPHFSNELISVFACRVIHQSEPRPSEYEDTHPEVRTRAQVGELIDCGRITDAKTISALFLYERAMADG